MSKPAREKPTEYPHEGQRVQVVIVDDAPRKHDSFDGCEGVLKQVGWNGERKIGKVFIENEGSRYGTQYFVLESLRTVEVP